MPAAHVLVVDDEPEIRALVQEVLEDEGYRVTLAESAEAATRAMLERRPDVVLLDVWLPDADGISVLRGWAEQGLPCPVVMMSGHGTIETAVEATRLGAYDFVEKPIGLAKLLLTLTRALEAGALKRENEALKRQLPSAVDPIGTSRLMQQLKALIDRAAQAEVPVLISGERGTGKENLARALHARSLRREAPFVHAHAGTLGATAAAPLFGVERDGAVSYGLLDAARGGSLYLEEINELDLDAQRALAVALETGRYLRAGGVASVALEARVIAGSSKPLANEVSAGRLDEALYYQLNVLPLALPPLRERPDDVPPLLAHFAEACAAREGLTYRRFSTAAQHRLRQHPWPGNLRELRNLVQRLLILGGSGDVELDEVERALGTAKPAAPQAATGGNFAIDLALPLREARDAFERAYLTRLLAQAGGSVTRLATLSGMERTHLYRKLRDLGIELKPGSGEATP